MIAESLDRPIHQPIWSADGKSLTLVVVDDRSQYPARIDVGSGRLERLVDGPRVVGNLTTATSDSSLAVLASTDTEPPEVAGLEGGKLRRLSHQNDEWLSGEDSSRDGD